ncbi:MAG TPA: hypothetical protein DCF89_06325, partial [Flavobacteriales bacterium]|nr:hypothetical protein [Flavobacteriales bacterium]
MHGKVDQRCRLLSQHIPMGGIFIGIDRSPRNESPCSDQQGYWKSRLHRSRIRRCFFSSSGK